MFLDATVDLHILLIFLVSVIVSMDLVQEIEIVVRKGSLLEILVPTRMDLLVVVLEIFLSDMLLELGTCLSLALEFSLYDQVVLYRMDSRIVLLVVVAVQIHNYSHWQWKLLR